MADTIKKGDFVEIEFTGTVKDDNSVFDTTDEKSAKEHGIHNPRNSYGPVAVCIGEGHLITGLEEQVEGKEVGKEYTSEIIPEKAFGKKDVGMMKLVPKNLFTKEKINPMPGMPVSIDGIYGIVKTAAGGRIIVDFNHPLAGKIVVYKWKVLRKIADDKEKLDSYISMTMGIKKDAFKTSVKEGNADVAFKMPIPEELKIKISEKIKGAISSIKSVNFTTEKSAVKA